MTALGLGSTYARERAQAELLSNAGAGVLGAGLSLLFADAIVRLAVPFLMVGGVVHAVAMYRKHRLDQNGGTALPRWSNWLYWTCWLLLLTLVGYVWWTRG